MKQLALDYLLETQPVKHMGIIMQVESIMQELTFKSYNSMLKNLGISYFAGVDSSSKIVKGNKLDYNTLILYLSASKNAGKDVCRFASTGCRLACLVASGRALMSMRSEEKSIQTSRLVKTWLVVFRRDIALKMLRHQIEAGNNKYKNFCVRLNGTSDLDFTDLMSEYPDVQFYDYTKDPTRLQADNYHITFSYSEASASRLRHYKQAIQRGQSIAIPVRADDYSQALELPNCFDMDKSDLRFLDKIGKYGILKAKVTEGMQDGMKNGFILSLE